MERKKRAKNVSMITPWLALLSSTRYPEEKAILDAARASVKRPQPTNLQLGDSLYFTDFKFFSMVTVSYPR